MLDKKEIEKIAQLARIRLTEDELNKFTDMNEILSLVDSINQVDTSDLTPMAHPLRIKQRLREDQVTAVNERENLQKIAPNNIEAGLYLVPEVFDS